MNKNSKFGFFLDACVQLDRRFNRRQIGSLIDGFFRARKMRSIRDRFLGHAISERQEVPSFCQTRLKLHLKVSFCIVGRYVAGKYSVQICLSRLSNSRIRMGLNFWTRLWSFSRKYTKILFYVLVFITCCIRLSTGVSRSNFFAFPCILCYAVRRRQNYKTQTNKLWIFKMD